MIGHTKEKLYYIQKLYIFEYVTTIGRYICLNNLFKNYRLLVHKKNINSFLPNFDYYS